MTTPASDRWRATDPGRARSLSDARLQVHYAAQFCTALGISYLRPAPDDSHTNLGWDGANDALMSRTVEGSDGTVCLGLRVQDLTLFVKRGIAISSQIALTGLTVEASTGQLRTALAAAGLEPSRYALALHYELPHHPLASGAPFQGEDVAALDQLTRWFGNAAVALDRLAHESPGASAVRVWPHHFDIATLVRFENGASTGAGLGPGDGYYEEPYFYVNAHPQPARERLTAGLAGGGRWHSSEWIGAVLPGSSVTGDATAQEAQVRAFLDSAMDACRGLVGA